MCSEGVREISAANAQAEELLALYKATGGAGWSNSDSWTSGQYSPCKPSDWYGVTCDDSQQVTEVNLGANNLVGTLPADLVDLGATLHTFNVDGNPGLTGSIPPELGAGWTGIERLQMSACNFRGWLPADVGAWTRLTKFNAESNRLSGPLPSPGLELMADLAELQLWGNRLTGYVPDAYADTLCALSTCDLHDNDLECPLPTNFSSPNCTSIEDHCEAS
jgi:hypothetical protein